MSKLELNFTKPAITLKQPEFVPMNRQEMDKLGWQELDILFISGDAYVDHPAFGISLLARLLIAHGFKTAVIAQPKWQDSGELHEITSMGCPRFFVGISAGSIDSMLAHYTGFRKKRKEDMYSPGGKVGLRPNRASIVYANLAKQAFPDTPVILGGIEASLRRVAHFDFWTNAIRRPLLFDGKADLLVYGMAELTLLELAYLARSIFQNNLCKEGRANNSAEFTKQNFLQEARKIQGLSFILPSSMLPSFTFPSFSGLKNTFFLPDYEQITKYPQSLLEATLSLELQMHQADKIILQKIDQRYVVLTAPNRNLATEELDFLYSFPFTRKAHPSYTLTIPAEEMLRTSITSHRGCAGGCSFCSLALHQGRQISSRSQDSIIYEINCLLKITDRGRRSKNALAVSDIGGPSANMWQAECTLYKGKLKSENIFNCIRRSCLVPEICPNFKFKQEEHIQLLRTIKKNQGISQVRVASGLRFDLLLTHKASMQAYILEFTGGQLKIAPEHISAVVLKYMRKPEQNKFEKFLAEFRNICKKNNKEQYIVPYLISAFPGCTLECMQELSSWLKARKWKPEQVQVFIPTPGTVATAMYYAKLDQDFKSIYVADTDAERLKQHAYLASRR